MEKDGVFAQVCVAGKGGIGGRKRARITSGPFSLPCASENPRGPSSHPASLPRPFIQLPPPPRWQVHELDQTPSTVTDPCMVMDFFAVFFSCFPELFKRELDLLFPTILFSQTTAWLIGCLKLIQVALRSL